MGRISTEPARLRPKRLEPSVPQIFQDLLRPYCLTYTGQIRYGNVCGSGVFQQGEARSLFQGLKHDLYPEEWSSSTLQFWDLLHAPTRYDNYQILHGDQTR